MFFLSPANIVFIAIAGLLLFIGDSFITLLMLVFLTDTIEYGQWKLGRRNGAVTFALQPFINKVGAALSTQIVAIAVYFAALDPLRPEAATPSALLIIRIGMLVVPPVLIVVSYLIYRAKYRIYKTDADLQAAHEAHPFVPIWDDHEVFNDYNREVFVDEPLRAAGAYQAWFEYQPVWPISGTRIHRDLPWGDLGHVFMLDGRQYRDPHRSDALPVGAMPITSYETAVGRTLLGDQQRDWLLDGLTAASAASTWKVIGNPVMISPLRVLDLDTPELRAQDPDLPEHAGFYTNSAFDSWDGFVWERDLLLSHLAAGGIENTVFVTGDYHSFWQSGLTPDFDDEAAPLVANEFAAGAISSGGGAINENVLFGGAENGPYQPGFNFIDGSHNGYGLLEATPTQMTVSYLANNATSATMVPRPIARFTLEAGDPQVAVERL